MMLRTYILILFLSFVSLSCNSKSGKRSKNTTNSSIVANNNLYTVKKVVDGDTFWVDDFDDENSKGIKIRLIGIDAPESRKSFKKEIGYYGKESKEYLINLLTGQKVILEYDVNRTDQYGRTLAYVYLEDGTFVNAELVKNGYAMSMTVPPNVKFADEFVRLQQEARKFNRGLWKE